MAEAKAAQEILEESESGGRKPKNWTRWLIFAVAVGWTIFQLWATQLGTIDLFVLKSIHLAFASMLAFLVYPYSKRSPRDRVPWPDLVLGLLAIAGPLYIAIQFQAINEQQGGVANARDIWFGTLTILLLLLAAWRVLGRVMPIIALVFILFSLMGPKGVFHVSLPSWLQFHAGFSWPQAVNQLYLTSEGIWGTPIGVSASFVFLFVLFGALLERLGAGLFLIQVAYSLLGTSRGGPAKAAVVASALHGMVSGSSVSNVVTVGSLTIPLMKRVGYPAETAGAIEVASGSNGQLMPPVMGAAAFIMANYLNIPYSQLIIYAALPAFLAYATLFVVVHLEALRLGLKGVPRSELPPLGPILRSGFHYILPLAYLIYALVIAKISAERAALNTVALIVVLMFAQELFRSLRAGKGPLAGLRKAFLLTIDGFENAGRGMVGIALATASAGIIVGVVTTTGLGQGLAQVVQFLSGGNIILVLLLAHLTSLLLGMGLPTTANYIVMASLVVPVVLNIADPAATNQALKIAAHMFVFYFGIMADSTPPVALAAYAASAIAKSDFWRTGIQGFVYEMRTAFLAYMFFFNPALLLQGVSGFGQALEIAGFAFLGMVAFASATMGFLHTKANPVQRILLLATALLLVTPGSLTLFGTTFPALLIDGIGVGLLLLIYLWQRTTTRAARAIL